MFEQKRESSNRQVTKVNSKEKSRLENPNELKLIENNLSNED